MTELKNKRVLVVGLGRSGLAAALFLRDRGARVTVSDTRSAADLAQEIPALLDAGIMVESGGHGLLTFRRQDLLVVSPGVPLDTPEIEHAQALGIPVIGELELASLFLRGEIVAVTGSNGKTTTTTLLGEIFQAGGRKTLVGGNIGLPVVELVGRSMALSAAAQPGADSSSSAKIDTGRAAKDDSTTVWNVLEVSSFQLETIVLFRPHIALVLNITPDHLDRHKTFERYAAAKTRITENQTAGDFLVLNADDKAAQMVAAKTRAQIFWFSAGRRVKQGAFVGGETIFFLAREGGVPEPVLPTTAIRLKGAHNVENVLAAVCAARLAGIASEQIRASVASFQGVAHRLEWIRTRRGVEFFNDSKATNVDATAKALASFSGGIHLILGGKDKASDYTLLAPLLRDRVRAVYTIGSAAEKIGSALGGATKIVEAKTLEGAVAAASAAASAGETVLLAPACASFDQFTSYEHRGSVFRALVEALEE